MSQGDLLICAVCEERTPRGNPICEHCGEDPRLDGRYYLYEVVGYGAVGTTFRAEEIETGREFAAKEMLIRRLDSAKAMQLFEREAATLQALDHPGVPQYFDDFSAGSGKTLGLYLIQEFVTGQTLGDEMADRSYGEDDVLDILVELLDVLEYLHSRRPPVVHRDLKPENIMRRDGGGLVVIDFGSVRRIVQTLEEGSTMAGTVGYMAPEQFLGQATPASDIYALGMTTVALVTGRHPHELMERDDDASKVIDSLAASPHLKSLLHRMTAHDADERQTDHGRLRRAIDQIRKGHDPYDSENADPETALARLDEEDVDALTAEVGKKFFTGIRATLVGGVLFVGFAALLFMIIESLKTLALLGMIAMIALFLSFGIERGEE